MKKQTIMFTETEKQALTSRLQQAARMQKRPTGRLWTRRMVVLCAAAALTVAVAGAVNNSLHTPLFDQAKASLTANGQSLASEARMVLNGDGSATITVSRGDGTQDVQITAPPATAQAMLSGTENGGFVVTRLNGAPYELVAEGGRLWLFVNERIPLDVTDLLSEGYTFDYTGEDGTSHTATVSGTVSDYEVK